MDDIRNKLEAISDYLSQPKEVQTDSGKVVNHSVDELIKAANYLRKLDATEDGEEPVIKRVGFYRVRNHD